MALPQPNELPEHVPHIPTELVAITMEGFKLITSVLEEIVEYLDDKQYGPAYLTGVNTKMKELKEFVDG